MAASRRLRQLILIPENNCIECTNALMESILTPTTSISQTTENHLNILNDKESSQDSRVIDLQQQQQQTIQLQEKHDHFEISSKTITKNKYKNTNLIKTIDDKTSNNNEDDWVCPVAVALRRAGYNVPLRPSKSWLERDRKKQALLRQQQTSSKEM